MYTGRTKSDSAQRILKRIVEKKMETTIVGYIEVILGLYKDTGKENGNYYSGLYRGYIRAI